MNWIHFLCWIAVIYGIYYAVLVLIDLQRSKQSSDGSVATNELTFSETHQPQKLEHLGGESDGPKDGSTGSTSTNGGRETEIVSTGGVGIRDLFTLARQEAIIYTRPVSF